MFAQCGQVFGRHMAERHRAEPGRRCAIINVLAGGRGGNATATCSAHDAAKGAAAGLTRCIAAPHFAGRKSAPRPRALTRFVSRPAAAAGRGRRLGIDGTPHTHQTGCDRSTP